LIKEFFIVVSMILLLAGFVLVHYVIHNGISAQAMLSSVTKVTKLSSPSLSVAYYEPRVLFYEEALNPAYPQMQTMNKMDLVYAQ
jgi:hypothetical protein